ncbi:YonK family protein [Bacillus sp. SCS-151]|uniref:YonK family protein n=1 Tax=Nanhaiella sioensis TaxID=3115293 RepID=UPI00397B8ED0
MAKITNSVAFKGDYSYLDMEITETSKESIDTYDLKEFLKRFDGKFISITIQEETTPEPKEHEGE